MPEPPPLPGWHLPYALPELSPSRISKRPSIFSLPAEVNLGSPSKLPNDNVLDGGPNSPPELGRNVDSNVERPAPMSASASSGVGKESSRFPFEFEDVSNLHRDLPCSIMQIAIHIASIRQTSVTLRVAKVVNRFVTFNLDR